TRILTMRMLVLPGYEGTWATSDWPRRIAMFPRKIVKRTLEHVDRLRLRNFVRRAARTRAYDIVIAVDDDATAAAAPLAHAAGIPLVYWSLELDTLGDGGDPLHLLTRAYAFRARRRAALTLVQDEGRARALERAGVRRETIRLVPNAPAGPASVTSGQFFHELFALPPTQRIILHAGAMIAQTRIEEVAASAASWPEDWTLVLHDREARPEGDPVTRRLEQLGGARVRISRRPVPYRELDTLFASADVSLAFYTDRSGENWSLIGSASGKLAHSLRVGVPVVCSALPGLKELVEDAGCGIAVNDPADAAAAIRRILGDAEGYRARAFACFRDQLDFGPRFAGLVREMEGLVDHSRKAPMP
ncbi:MAG: hypothetical protein JWO05_4, partial [Gemmatimonadetes bacterium]|nr:hypothetical protein [Gemmatimonadota bacterium]